MEVQRHHVTYGHGASLEIRLHMKYVTRSNVSVPYSAQNRRSVVPFRHRYLTADSTCFLSPIDPLISYKASGIVKGASHPRFRIRSRYPQ